MKRVMIQYDNGLWVPKDMCTIDRFGKADDCTSCKEVCEDLDGDCEECPVQGIFNRLAEYEDMEEQGKLLKLLCNVGDTVYQIIGGFIEPCTVKGIFLTGEKDENGNQLYMMGLHYDRENCIFTSAKVHSSYIGKTIFLTMEGAENELQIEEGIHAEKKEQPETE